MIQIETQLLAIDKLGILKGKCIHVYRGFYKKTTATTGDKILVSIRKRNATKITLKKKTNQAILAHVNIFCRRLSGNYYRFDNNGFLTLHTDGSYRGGSLRKPLPRELFFSSLKDAGFLTVALF
jgi:ribosomal protein L14